MRGHSCSVQTVAFSPSGLYIASASLNGEVKLWSADRGVMVSACIGLLGLLCVFVFVFIGGARYKKYILELNKNKCLVLFQFNIVVATGGVAIRSCTVCQLTVIFNVRPDAFDWFR